MADLDAVAQRLRTAPGREERVLHERLVPARRATTAPWPGWVAPPLREALVASGVAEPWVHQVVAAEHARAGRHVVVSTGTASGKSLAYLLPALTAALEPAVGRGPGGGPGSGSPPGVSARLGAGGTTLYLAPTKALAADQLAAIDALGVPGVRAATYDGDTPADARRWVRDHADVLLTNPDMLHRSLLPGHARFSRIFRRLRYVVVDECHHYRGLFGSHVAAVLRRLLRVAEHHGAAPTVVLASATVAQPAASAAALTGLDVVEVTDDASPRGGTRFWLWEPPLLPGAAAAAAGERAAGAVGGAGAAAGRRSVVAESADLLADLVAAGVATLVFVRSRRGAEVVASLARGSLAEADPAAAGHVAAYRAGYLPEERRALEADLRAGRLLGVASTSALELGIDVAGLDAVVVAGWPGTRASLWQRVGRAGRGGGDALAVLVADDDPLDTYLVHHPEAIFDAPLEATVIDPGNPHVLGGQLCAAAAEVALRPEDLARFGPTAPAVLEHLVAAGLLRARPNGWFWTSRERASALSDLRGSGGAPISLVDEETGRVMGTVDAAAAHRTVHEGAVYVHQGRRYRVVALDESDATALLRTTDADESTSVRSVSDVRVLEEIDARCWGPVRLVSGTVEVSSQVTSYLRRRESTGAVIAEERLDLPERTLRTRSVWWTLPDGFARAAGVDPADVLGALHAAEHAAIGLLPLVATCDRWDVGGLSTDRHPDTGLATVFVHDAAPGGAGFADRGFAAARTWLGAVADLLADCGCATGCPSCVQSPKCGNGNEPLDKAGALAVLRAVLAEADAGADVHGPVRGSRPASPPGHDGVDLGAAS